MWIRRRLRSLSDIRPKLCEHLVRLPPEHERVGGRSPLGARTVDLWIGHRPVQVSVRRGEIAVGGHAIEGYDASRHVILLKTTWQGQDGPPPIRRRASG